MERQIVPFTTQESWLEARTHDLTSTDIPVLFGIYKYDTARGLWESKKNRIVVELKDTTRMKVGRKIESFIAEFIAEEHGLGVVPFKEYIRIPSLRVGSSFDYKIISRNGVETDPEILEIKNVDGKLWKEWHNKDGELSPPHHIEAQIQMQLFVSGYKKATVGVLFGGNNPQIIERVCVPEIQEEIIKRSKRFWESIDNNDPPRFDYDNEKDLEIIKSIYARPEEGRIMTEIPHEVGVLVEQNLDLYADKKKIEQIMDGNIGRITELTSGYAKIIGNNWKASWVVTQGKPDTVITSGMVGQTIKGRSGSKSLRITKNT